MPAFGVSTDKTIRVSKEDKEHSGYVHFSLQDNGRVMGTISIRYAVFTYHQNLPTGKQYQMTPMEEEHWDIEFDTQTPEAYWRKNGSEFQRWFVNHSDEKVLPSGLEEWAPFNAFVAKAMLLQGNPASINWIVRNDGFNSAESDSNLRSILHWDLIPAPLTTRVSRRIDQTERPILLMSSRDQSQRDR